MSNTVKVRISGMHCGSCSDRVKQTLEAVSGVKKSHVSLAMETAILELDEEISPGTVLRSAKKQITEAGYGLKPEADYQTHIQILYRQFGRESRDWRQRALLGAVLTTPILVLEMGSHLIGFHLPVVVSYLLAIASLIVLAGPGRSFFTRSFGEFRRMQFTMDSLIAVGSGASWLYSFAVLLGRMVQDSHASTHFESAALIVTMICFGRMIEKRQRQNTFSGLVKLIRSLPNTVLRIENGEAEEVPVDMIESGEIIEVNAGRSTPLDGVVVEGRSMVDLSVVTGEPEPVLAEKDRQLPCGAVCIDGKIRLRVTGSGEESSLTRTLKQIESAQLDRSRTNALIDRIIPVFVPTVMILSVVVFAIHLLVGSPLSLAMMAAFAVLVVACPCALGIATPAVMMAGSSLLARHGVFLQDSSALESSRDLTDIIFDKTGTLTESRSRLASVSFDEGKADAEKVLRLAATLEDGTSHPLGLAIIDHAEQNELRPLMLMDSKVIPGGGIEGMILGKKYFIGSPDFVDNQTENPAPDYENLKTEFFGEKTSENHQGEVWLAEKKEGVLAIFRFENRLRPQVSNHMKLLRQNHNLQPCILSGDRKAPVLAIAKQAGISESNVRWSCSPEDKKKVIEKMTKKGRRCAFVGDGINDSAALSSARLGIVTGEGTDVAKISSQIQITGKGIGKVIVALRLLDLIRWKIRQNLIFAFSYNALLIPMAATGFIHPGLAAFAMAASSISVVGNASLMNRVRLNDE